jgi:molybdenum cofactor cytidylyltransferase
VISGVVLAAGAGRRFGSSKQIASHRGKPLAQHAIDALAAAGLDELIVVTGSNAHEVEGSLRLPPAGRFVRNDRWADGQSTSLATALHDVSERSEAAVILMADQPGITADDVAALIRTFASRRPRIVRLAYSDGPGPALLSREIYGEAAHLIGDVGASVLMASHPDWVEEVRLDRPVPTDVDEPADLDRIG